MNKSNEIALQLTNNFTEDINVALFPTVNSNQFVQSQTQQLVEGQRYDVGSTIYGLDESVNIVKTNKLTGETSVLNIPYTGTPEGSGIFDPDGFVLFCYNWFPANGYGYVYEQNAPDMTIFSDLYEYGDLDVPES